MCKWETGTEDEVEQLTLTHGGQCDECGDIVARRVALEGAAAGIDVCFMCAVLYPKAQGGTGR